MGIFDRALDRARALLVLQTPARDVIDDPNQLSKSGGRLFQSTSAMYNALTGLGTSRDPSFWNRWAVARPLQRSEIFGMGRNGLIVQALGKLPNTATREGWRVDITDPDVDSPGTVADEVAAYEARLGTGRACARAIFRGRQYSDALVLLGVADGRSWDQPVDRTAIKTLKWVAVIDKRDFEYAKLYPSGTENFGKVEQFEITDINGVLEDGLRYGYGSITYTGEQLDLIDDQTRSAGRLLVHADRVLHFPTADYLSLLDTLQDSLGAFFEAMSGIRNGARESSMVVYKISNWIRKMWSENVGLATRHMAFVDKAKSSLNAWVIDKTDEEVSMISRNVSGLSKLADPFMVWLAAALAMPVTVLWGVSPGGFGKGEAERETWHEEVRAFQDNVLAPQLFKLHGYILAAFDGPQLSYDTQRKVKFNDLTPPDEEKTSKLRNEALMELRQQAKEGFITRSEFRNAASQLSDDFYRLELDTEFVDRPAPAQVGIFTGSIALLQALFPPEAGGIPPEAGRALLLALDPVHFDPSNVSQIIPLSETPPSAPTGEATPPTPDETDDVEGEDEDAEFAQLWSTKAPPSDAMSAKKLAKHPELEGRVRGLEITLAAKKQAVPTYKSLLGKPVYSLAEVKRALLSGNGFAPQTDARIRDAHEPELYKASFMLRLPEHLARWVPYKQSEQSAPHVTIAYLGKIAPEQFAKVFDVGREVISSMSPIDVELGDVGYFDNDERVAFASVQSPGLQDLHTQLVEALGARSIEVSTHESGYVPHVTLAYMESGTEYEGPAPRGQWTATAIEFWYDDFALPISCAPASVQDESAPVRDPFKTEHAARQREPEDFDEDTFRRIEITEGIDAVVGKLASKPDGGMVVQTYRFDAEKFTPAQARAWLVEQGTQRESVEAARDIAPPVINVTNTVLNARDLPLPDDHL